MPGGGSGRVAFEGEAVSLADLISSATSLEQPTEPSRITIAKPLGRSWWGWVMAFNAPNVAELIAWENQILSFACMI